MTTWRSTPRSAHSSSPAKSVIVAQTGLLTLPRRRRQPRIIVVTGHVETTTSASAARVTRRIDRDPVSDSSHRATALRAATVPQAPEEEREEPGGPAELPAVGVAEEPRQRARQLLERVHDDDRGVRP